jgi:hypothetical protein
MSYLQTLDRLISQKTGEKLAPEEMQQLRYISSKILQHVTSSPGKVACCAVLLSHSISFAHLLPESKIQTQIITKVKKKVS